MDDHAGVPAELERHALLRVEPLQVPTDLRGAGERDLAVPVVASHAVGDLRGDRQDLIHPLRQVGLGEELRESERADRGGARGLHDDRGADGERGRDLVRHEVQREVERGDAQDRPDREPPDEAHPGAERRFRIQPHELVVPVADHLRGPAERRDGARRLDRGPLERLAAFLRDQLRVLLDRLAEALRDVVERFRTGVDRELRRLLEGLVRRGRRFLDVGLGRHADLRDDAVVVGAVDLERALARPPLAVHQIGPHGHVLTAFVFRGCVQSSDTITCLMFV